MSDALAADDRELMTLTSTGSVEAFRELYDRYGGRAHRLALSVCHDAGRAQDAVQDAFISIWMNRASYRGQRGTVAAWLLAVVRYRAIDLERRNGKHAARWENCEFLDDLAATDNVCEQALRSEDAERLRASLALLPDPQQEVIKLAFYGQLSHTEIAAKLGLAGGTVKGRMRLGMQKLRASLEQA